jgi:hypothetical protein
MLGMILLVGDTLRDWQVKTFPGPWSDNKLRIIKLTIERYVMRHKVEIIALKLPEGIETSHAVRQLLTMITKLGKDRMVAVYTATVADLKAHAKVRNKKELMRYCLLYYPELGFAFKKAESVKRIYYVRIFEAVVAAMHAQSTDLYDMP